MHDREVQVFGRKRRAERLKKQAESKLVPAAALAAFFAEARPVAERLLYDDELQDNVRAFIEAANSIYNDIRSDSPGEIVSRLWDDNKLRGQIESATSAAQEGSKRVRGEKVKSGGGGGILLLLICAAAAFIFLNPRTGPEARRLVKDALGALDSGN